MSIHIQNLIDISIYTTLSFFIAALVFPGFIRFVQRYKLTKSIREETVDGKMASLFRKFHLHKAGTPTMGGVVIIFAILATVGLTRVFSYFGVIDYSLLNRGETYLPLFTLAVVGLLGVLDDWLNIKEYRSQKGLSSRVKFWSLVGFAVVGAWWFTTKLGWGIIHVPAVGDFDIGLWYAPLFIFILVGTANSVNITDGLDGLAGGLLAVAYGVFAVISYFYGLPILAALCMVIAGAITAFLWFNVPPAAIYMGDTGSLALGATLGVIAMLTNAVIVLAIVCIPFVVETLSVMLQLFWKRVFKKKLFKIAPLHHHFEALGWSETKIVMRFWIVGVAFGAMGLIVGLFGMGDGGLL